MLCCSFNNPLCLELFVFHTMLISSLQTGFPRVTWSQYCRLMEEALGSLVRSQRSPSIRVWYRVRYESSLGQQMLVMTLWSRPLQEAGIQLPRENGYTNTITQLKASLNPSCHSWKAKMRLCTSFCCVCSCLSFQ